MNLGWQYYWSRQYDLAADRLRKVLEIDPNFEQARWALGLAYQGKGMAEEAVMELQRAAELSGNNPVYLAALGHARALAGADEAALAIRARLEEQSKTRYVSPYWVATLHAGLGEVDLAFGMLEQAYEERSGGMIWLALEPDLESLRTDPRFAALVERVRLPR
jgi:tetratricopeptide (TPR) repeat protein